MTADNASSNRTMISSLTRKLTNSANSGTIEPEQATIRCLAHIIHLAVMSLLAGVGVIPKPADGSDPISSNHDAITLEEMEEYSGDGVEAGLSDDDLAFEAEYEGDRAVSIIARVCRSQDRAQE